MVDTLENIRLPVNTWVDLYSETEITVGIAIFAQNIGASDIFLSTQASEPTDTDKYQVIKSGVQAINEDGDSGAWVYSLNSEGLVNAGVV